MMDVHMWVSVYSYCFLQLIFQICLLHKQATDTHTHTHTHSHVFMTFEDITLTYIHSL